VVAAGIQIVLSICEQATILLLSTIIYHEAEWHHDFHSGYFQDFWSQCWKGESESACCFFCS